MSHREEISDLRRRIAHNRDQLRLLAAVRQVLAFRAASRRDERGYTALELNDRTSADLRKTLALQGARLADLETNVRLHVGILAQPPSAWLS